MQSECAPQESNLGRHGHNVEFYHWTRGARCYFTVHVTNTCYSADWVVIDPTCKAMWWDCQYATPTMHLTWLEHASCHGTWKNIMHPSIGITWKTVVPARSIAASTEQITRFTRSNRLCTGFVVTIEFEPRARAKSWDDIVSLPNPQCIRHN